MTAGAGLARKELQDMYEAHFGLGKRPFAAIPRIDQYYPARAIEAARQTLVRCIQRAEGAAVVIGPSGTGKTLLCQMLAKHFEELFDVVLLSSGRLSTRRAMLQAILHSLGESYRGMDEGELRLTLIDYLSSTHTCPAGMVLLVDEAHTLPMRLLDEIRMLTNLVANGQPRVRLALSGGPLLEERFAHPRLESFSQRLIARCYLESFNRSETEAYIRSQIERTGGPGDRLFTADACQAVYQATDGVPRLVNQVCDHALLSACAACAQVVDGSRVEEAWANLQQLPMPWNASAKTDQAANSVIEFGGLDEEPELSSQRAGAVEAADEDRQVATLPLALPGDLLLDSPIEPAEEPDEDQVAVSTDVDDADDLVTVFEDIDEIDDFQPVGSIRPKSDALLRDPNNPFGESFEMEEIVVDRYAEILAKREREGLAQLNQDGAAAGSFDETDSPEPETVPMHRDVATIDHPAEEIVVEDDADNTDPSPTRPAVRVQKQEYRQLFSRLRHG